MDPASFAVVVIKMGSWFGGDGRELGDSKRSVVGSEGIDGVPNVGRIAACQLKSVTGMAYYTYVRQWVHLESYMVLHQVISPEQQ